MIQHPLRLAVCVVVLGLVALNIFWLHSPRLAVGALAILMAFNTLLAWKQRERVDMLFWGLALVAMLLMEAVVYFS
jgi:hypothetical protein